MTFEINGKEYEAAKYDFNTHCEFDSYGVNAIEISTRPLPVLRAYLAICGDMSLTQAGRELEKHFIGGGKLEEITTCLMKELDASDFFMEMIKKLKESMTEEEEAPKEAPKEAPAKTKRVRSTKKNG